MRSVTIPFERCAKTSMDIARFLMITQQMPQPICLGKLETRPVTCRSLHFW